MCGCSAAEADQRSARLLQVQDEEHQGPDACRAEPATWPILSIRTRTARGHSLQAWRGLVCYPERAAADQRGCGGCARLQVPDGSECADTAPAEVQPRGIGVEWRGEVCWL